MKSPSGPTGFTLTEILIALAVISVAAAASLPSLSMLTASSRIDHSVNELVHSFQLGRQISRLSGVPVTVCPSTNGQTCDPAGDWRSGWLVFTGGDDAGTAAPQPGEIVRAVHIPNGRPAISANRPHFILRQFGKRSTNGTLHVCDPLLPEMRKLIISYTGKPRISRLPATECPAHV